MSKTPKSTFSFQNYNFRFKFFFDQNRDFVLGRNQLVLTADDYVDEHENDGCQLSFMTIGIPDDFGPMLVLGEPFLFKYYTVFDREELRVGFSPFESNDGLDDRLRRRGSDEL